MTMIVPRFDARSTAQQVVDGHDLRGRVAIVTGATTGIGVETARAFASAGASVIVGARDMAKGRKIAGEIARTTHNQAVHVVRLDLSCLESVRSFAEAVCERMPAVHFLINNAA